jgi:hypothetical protein
MKRVVALVLAVCFFVTVMPAFRDSGNAYGTTIFQRLRDHIVQMGRENPDTRQTAWTAIFKNAQDNISAWSKGSQEASLLSLRGNPAKLAERRGL